MFKPIVAFCFLGTPAVAQAIDCSAVLSRDLVNIRDISVSESIISNMQSDICSQEFESASQAQSRMRDGGWTLNVFGYFDNALVDSTNTGSSAYNVRNSEFCDKSASELSRSLGTDFLETNAQFVLQAYQECVRITEESGLWMTYEIVEDGSALRGVLRRKASPNTPLGYEIEDLSISTTDSASVDCNLASNGDEFSGDAIQARSVNAGTATFTCIKRGEGAAFVDLRTSIVEFPLYMPSETVNDHAEVDALRDRIVQLEASYGESQTELQELRAIAGNPVNLLALSNRLVIDDGQGANVQQSVDCRPDEVVTACYALMQPSGAENCNISIRNNGRTCVTGGCAVPQGQTGYRLQAVCTSLSSR